LRQNKSAAGGAVTKVIVCEKLSPGAKTQTRSAQRPNEVSEADQAVPVMFALLAKLNVARLVPRFLTVRLKLTGWKRL